ncbi:hypothetical protein [Mucilaginibacter pineti]|nr:hypothetical protein [Mucilaginibacter pineti]
MFFEYKGDLLDHILDQKIATIPDWPTNLRQPENGTGPGTEV